MKVFSVAKDKNVPDVSLSECNDKQLNYFCLEKIYRVNTSKESTICVIDNAEMRLDLPYTISKHLKAITY